MNPKAAQAETMAQAIRETALEHGSITAVQSAEGDLSYTWAELVAEMDQVAGGLSALGVERGKTVALMMGNRPEFHIADMAVVTAGGTPFSVYQTYTPAQIAYLLEDAQAEIAIVSTEYLQVFKEAGAQVATLGHCQGAQPGF
ncbi:MAG: AMP-binding protein [Solirubrobacterales bacterium]|nr:AMP-binding protein [Solirubrobacterales bacterium]